MLFTFLTLLLSHSGLAAPVSVPKAKFTEEFRTKLPAIFCAEKSYFRKCFTVTPELCKSTTTKAPETCLAKMDKELPSSLQQSTEVKNWGEKLGSCAGEKFETDLEGSQLGTEECKDLSKWQ